MSNIKKPTRNVSGVGAITPLYQSDKDPIIRDKRTKEAFIEYLVAHPDERFYQALTNFANVDFIGSASTPEGGDFEDLWNVEADERMVSYE